MSCFQFKLSRKNYSFRESRLVFANPEDGEPGDDTLPSREIAPEEEIAKETRIDLESARDGNIYALGKFFDLNKEKKSRNISARAVEFINKISHAEECLKELYEYDAYSYIHVVQMLNEGCRLVDEHLDAIKKVVVPENLSDEELKKVFIGAIIFHDWGKIEVGCEILNGGRDLTPEQWEEMERHSIYTMDILVPEVVNETSSNVDKQMAYTALSHHRHRIKIESGRDCPRQDEIERSLSGYSEWFKLTGNKLSTILSILDSNDAMRSERSYKEPYNRRETWDFLQDDYLNNAEDKERYGEICGYIFDDWKEMAGAKDYTRDRKEIDSELMEKMGKSN